MSRHERRRQQNAARHREKHPNPRVVRGRYREGDDVTPEEKEADLRWERKQLVADWHPEAHGRNAGRW